VGLTLLTERHAPQNPHTSTTLTAFGKDVATATAPQAEAVRHHPATLLGPHSVLSFLTVSRRTQMQRY
jgi:hypothetical protein